MGAVPPIHKDIASKRLVINLGAVLVFFQIAQIGFGLFRDVQNDIDATARQRGTIRAIQQWETAHKADDEEMLSELRDVEHWVKYQPSRYGFRP